MDLFSPSTFTSQERGIDLSFSLFLSQRGVCLLRQTGCSFPLNLHLLPQGEKEFFRSSRGEGWGEGDSLCLSLSGVE